MATDRPAETPAGHASEQSGVHYTAMLRGAAVPTAAVGVGCVVIAAFVGGREARSAALGALLVLVFFSLSLVVMKRTAHLPPTTVMAVVLASYTAKIVALGVAMVLLRDVEWLSGRALALTIIGCTVVWLAFELRAFTRLRILVAPQADAAAPQGASDEGGER